MTARILRLHPGPPEETALVGTWLADRLHAQGTAAAPFVYGSFVGSLDGRIALKDPDTGESRLPPGLTGDNDFRVVLELQAQADCLITHGGYLRAIADGKLDDILQVTAPDLVEWRRGQGLDPQPAILVASGSLDFTVPDAIVRNGQRVMIATGAAAPADRVAALRRQGHDVIVAGSGTSVEGAPLVRELGARGFRSLYLLTGPRMLETMLRGRVLSRLYLTIVHRILGGTAFHSLIDGPELGPEGRMRLESLHYDAAGPDGAGQWFARFEPLYGDGAAVP
jgi:riboflavin biosynthesis pyrimidine reductase